MSWFFKFCFCIISFSIVNKYIIIHVDGWKDGYLNSYLKSNIGLCKLLYILDKPAYCIDK